MTSILRDQTDEAILYLSHHAPECFQDEIDAEMAYRIGCKIAKLNHSPIARTTSPPVKIAKNMPRNRFLWQIRLWGSVALFFALAGCLAIWAMVIMQVMK